MRRKIIISVLAFLVGFVLAICGPAYALELVRQKNVASYIVFPLVDADGDLVSGATSPDSEMDAFTDGAAPDGFADCTNEATEIGSTGNYYLSLTNTELNNDYIIIQIKSGTAKTQVIIIRTQVGDPLLYATTDDGGTINVTTGAVDTVTTTGTATNVTTVNGFASGAINATAIAADALGASEFAQAAADKVWATATRILTHLDEDTTTIDINATTIGTVTTVSDKTGYSLAADQAVNTTKWNGTTVPAGVNWLDIEAMSEKTINWTNINDLSGAGVNWLDIDVLSDVGINWSDIDRFSDAGLNWTDSYDLHSANVNWADVDVMSDASINWLAINELSKTGINWLDLATVDAVWDEPAGSHVISGSTGGALGAAGSAGDPWETSLPGAYSSGTAGYIIGNNLNAPIGTVDTVVDAIKAKTDNLPTDPADASVVAGLIAALNNLSISDIDARLAAIGLDHLVAAAVIGSDVVDNSLFAKLASKSATADWDSFNNTTESLEALRDRGDAAWITATGFSTVTAQQVWEYATRALTELDEDNTTIDLNASTIGTVTNVSDKTGYRLSGAGVDDIWDEALSGHSTAGTAGKKLSDIPESGTGDWTAGEKTLIKQALGVDDGDVDTGATLDALYSEIKKARGR